jgi:hypothetical protein
MEWTLIYLGLYFGAAFTAGVIMAWHLMILLFTLAGKLIPWLIEFVRMFWGGLTTWD